MGETVSSGVETYGKVRHMEYSKKLDLVKLINKTLELAPDDDARIDILDDEQTQQAYLDIGQPLPKIETKSSLESPWGDTTLMERIHAAATPEATELEKDRGGLRWGGVPFPPRKRVPGRKVDVKVGIKSKREFATEDEALAANLPKGTRITVGGQEAEVE